MVIIVRVIAGTAGGLRLKTLEGRTARPTSDIVKGGLFNILAPDIRETTVLDLFSGTGALGIEALSRGAKRAVFIDNNPKCIEIIRENILYTGFGSVSSVVFSDGPAAINNLSRSGEKFDIILIDPPYDSDIITLVLKRLAKDDIINSKGIVAIECDKNNVPPDLFGPLKAYKKRYYGRTALVFYMKDKNDYEGNAS